LYSAPALPHKGFEGGDCSKSFTSLEAYRAQGRRDAGTQGRRGT